VRGIYNERKYDQCRVLINKAAADLVALLYRACLWLLLCLRVSLIVTHTWLVRLRD